MTGKDDIPDFSDPEEYINKLFAQLEARPENYPQCARRLLYKSAIHYAIHRLELKTVYDPRYGPIS